MRFEYKDTRIHLTIDEAPSWGTPTATIRARRPDGTAHVEHIGGDETRNVLTRAVLARLPKYDGQKVIYCAGCLLGRDRLQAERIIVRQAPYEIKVS